MEVTAREEKTEKTSLLDFRPLTGDTSAIWQARLDAELLTLSNPSGASALTVHRDEAARYLKFIPDVMRGRTVSFSLGEGLKSYSFRCTRDQQSEILAWLPQKPPELAAKEIRYSGLGVALFGTLHLLLPERLFWGWGVWLVLIGLYGAAFPRPVLYLVNGLIMFFVGLWDVVPWIPFQNDLVAVAVGTALILWGIQQVAMLSPNQQLRAARAFRDRQAQLKPSESPLVRIVGWCNVGGAVLCGAYALAVALIATGRGFQNVAPDLGAFTVFAVLMGLSAAVFLGPRHAGYVEAKVSAQFLVSAAIFTLWGLIFAFDFSAPAAVIGGIFSGDLRSFTRPYVWISLIVSVLLLNRWLTHRTDRELEERRD